MITETRQITFSSDELIECIVAHLRMMKQKLPAGTITGVHLEDTPDITVALVIEDVATQKPQRVIVKPEVVGAAMIAHCKRQQIPIPRRGVKSLIISGNSIGLSISTGGKPTSLFEIADE